MNARLMLLLGAAAALVAGGCQPPNIAPAPGLADPYPAPINDPQITVHDEELRAFLGFQPAVVVNDGERPLLVEVPVRNLADSPRLIDYRFVFFDAAGLELEPVMGWHFQPMQPKQTVRLKARAPHLTAINYKLEVKWAR
jgi:uncharacterized protein YcfL